MSYCQDIKHISVKSEFTAVYNGLETNNDLKVQGGHGLLVVIEERSLLWTLGGN